MYKLIEKIAKNYLFKNIRAINENIHIDMNSCSDLFIYRNDNFETIYIQENTKSLYFANESKFEIIIYFFNKYGKFISSIKQELSSYDHTIYLNKLAIKLDDYGCFFISSIKKNILFKPHFRGYVGYKKRNSKQYNFAHGNFGALYVEDFKKNIFRSFVNFSKNTKFFYTPQTMLNKYQYFYITNPIDKVIDVSFFQFNKKLFLLDTKKIQPFQTIIFNNKKISDGTVPVFSSNLPALRPIIFEENQYYFDCYHS